MQLFRSCQEVVNFNSIGTPCNTVRFIFHSTSVLPVLWYFLEPTPKFIITFEAQRETNNYILDKLLQ